MTKVKFCGLTREQDIAYANQLRPDYIGFVFAPSSRRYVAPQRAGELKAMLNPEIQVVGVFVREQLETVVSLVKAGTIEIVQLHGGEETAYVHALKAQVGCPVIQAFRIACEADIRNAEQSPADLILLDNGSGGTGTAFDWAYAADVRRPFFLAGGLSPENAAEAVRSCRPFALDVSSGIETDGVKDFEKMERLLRAIRRKNDGR